MNILSATYDGTAFQVSGQTLPCPASLYAQLQPLQGQTYDLGARPEHLQLTSEAGHLTVAASVVEPRGREVLVRAMLPSEPSSPSCELAFQCRPDQCPRVGDRLSLALDLDQLFVFDRATGLTLVYPQKR